jgi:hypothetical protein
MSLRTAAALTFLILLQLCGCATTSEPSDPTTNELEQRQNEIMNRVGCASSM